MLNEYALGKMREALIATIRIARYRIGENWHETNVLNKSILPDRKMNIQFSMCKEPNETGEMNRVCLIDGEGNMLFQREERIQMTEAGMQYRITLRITQDAES